MTLTVIPKIGLPPEAKSRLSAWVQDLRGSLIKDLEDAVQSTYRLSLPLQGAGLSEGDARRRQRLESWLDEQDRGGTRGARETVAQARQRHCRELVKLAASTLLNRLVVLRQMEALGLVRVKVLTGGWESTGYREYRAFAPGLLGDGSEGYAELLRLTFDELALDLPGLFGTLGPTALIPLPSSTLRLAVEAFEDPALAEAWTDDTTLGWVYQFWNDPDRIALDEKIRNAGKIENHEIAAKTQLFTDRYMVEWILQNSLGQLWFSICRKNGWTPDVAANGTLDALEARRAEWRARRDAGEVDQEALMPLESEEEDRWKYWVPRDLPEDAAEHAPSSLREVRLLDPACGSGHFLVIAFDLMAALYEEEARHRGEHWEPQDMARWILEDNLHGIDLDPRAVQIAAAALWLKARTWCSAVRPRRMNIVASNLGLGSLPKDDPAVLELFRTVERETGIPARLTATIVEALKGADSLGSLLKVEGAVEDALDAWDREQRLAFAKGCSQGDLFRGYAPEQLLLEEDTRAAARRSIVDRLEGFLRNHTGADELGLRLRGEQLAAGVRFLRMLREGQYHLVVGNPPYQGTGKMADATYVLKHYPDGKADLSIAFMVRSLQLLQEDGLLLLLAVRGWMFIGQFEAFRTRLLAENSLQVLGDFDWGAFSEVVGKVLCVTAGLIRKQPSTDLPAVAIQPFPLDTPYRNDNRRAFRKAAATLVQVGRVPFRPSQMKVLPGWPLVYWWKDSFIDRYSSTPKLGEQSAVRQGMATAQDTRFLRFPWEVARTDVHVARYSGSLEGGMCELPRTPWVPFIKGAEGKAWMEPLSTVLRWHPNAMEVKSLERDGKRLSVPRNEWYYFRPGVAFPRMWHAFFARIHRCLSVFGDKGSSVFPENLARAVCLMNSREARDVLCALNPGLGFEVGDVNRLPLFPIESADEIVSHLDTAFTEHESHREPSVEFKRPGPSCWTWAQDWAQQAVDRPTGAPLPPWEPVHVQEPPLDHLSFALGVAMGRFGADGEGILDAAPAFALPHGILFIAVSDGLGDSLEHAAAHPLHQAWSAHGAAIALRSSLGDYLRLKFFADDHVKRYEKRPITFPLSSEKKSFVAWVSIHRWRDDTLQVLLADFLNPALARLAGELADLAEARLSGDRKDQVKAQVRFNEVMALHEELRAFVNAVEEIAERGAPPPGKSPRREADARFRMDLDDGVMINSAALWPLLRPQWKDPEKWWAELCEVKGKKDYDWSHLAARYFPRRVDARCQVDPSLAVAHGCFWKYHPDKACQWELRLQAPDELGPDFRLDEPGSDLYRADFERHHPDRVRELREIEERRRQRKAGVESEDGQGILPLEWEEDTPEE